MHDIVITDATIVDGSGAPSRTGDVAIDGDRITEVGAVEGGGHRVIEAEGRLVTPGWVDVHTHYDGQVTWDPEVSPSGWHGVTTVVMGNCGVGFAPVRAQDRDWLIQLMEGVEDIPGAALAEGMSWNWETFGEYLDEVERMDRVLDVAALLPHGALRAYVLGEGRGNDIATADEIARMHAIAKEAIADGAVGISTTRTLLHRAKDGELAAGTTAAADELIALGDALGGAGHRVFSVASDLMDLQGEIAWMAEISRRNQVPVTYQVLQADFAPDLWRSWIDEGLTANRSGAWLVPQVAGKPASILVGFESSFHPFVRHAAYQPLADLPHAERVAALATPEIRAAILAEEVPPGGPMAMLMASTHKVFPLGDPVDYEPSPERSVQAIADREGRPVLEVMYDLMLRHDGTELLYLPILGYAGGGLNAIEEMLNHPATVLGLGDGGAHCGVLCDASLPTFMLTHWTRDRDRGGRLSVEQVVHHQTARTAALYGFRDRGLLAPGMLADLNVIDYDGLALHRPRMAYDLPAGGKRLVQGVTGYGATIKSGVVVREDDQPTGARPGGLIRGPQARPSGALAGAGGGGVATMSAVDETAAMTDEMNRRTIAVNGVELSVIDVGSGPPVILAHGFPELAYSWRHQIGPIAEAGYRVLAPDQRGYGRSTQPADVADYDIIHLTDDLLALLDDIGQEKAVFVGHDWGSMVVWALAQRAPERVAGVVGMSVPFVPRAAAPPTQMMRAVFGEMFFYMLYFQEPGVPDAELGGDPATMMRRMLAGLGPDGTPAEIEMFAPRAEGGFIPRLPEPSALPDWLSQAELDHYIAEFTRTGFTGGINWYRNLDRNWSLTEDLAGAKVTPPALFIAGGADPVLMMAPLDAMHESVPDLRGSVIIEGAGHWVQQEAPAGVNEPLLGFIASVLPTT